MIKVYRHNKEAKLPTRNLPTDAGLDLYSLEDVFVPKNTSAKIRTGISIEIPKGYVGKLESRSSMAVKGVTVEGGVIDCGFTGELSIIMINHTNSTAVWEGVEGYKIIKGDRIAQLLLYKVELDNVVEVNELWVSDRGNKGLGSSGK